MDYFIFISRSVTVHPYLAHHLRTAELDSSFLFLIILVGPTPPQSSFGGSGSTFNNADNYYGHESTLDDKVEHQEKGGNASVGNDAGYDHDDHVDDNEGGGSPNFELQRAKCTTILVMSLLVAR